MLYRQLIDSLMYLVNTKPNISFVVNSLSQFMVELKRVLQTAVKHVLRCLRATIKYAFKYTQGDGIKLMGYTDVNWANSAMDRKSTLGCCFSMGLGVVSWYSKKQKSMALSSIEAKYIAASMETCQAISLRELLVALFGQRVKTTMIHCNNRSSTKLSENMVFHDRLSIQTSNIISSRIVYSIRQLSYNIYLQVSRQQIS